ncbi:ATP-binding cassette domain-containing protein (plasmid) [Streptomyces sp. SYP-A7193]|nr:ATP-binding cassette domain-containing protein [Streptomyces sp. SYP-A7193]
MSRCPCRRSAHDRGTRGRFTRAREHSPAHSTARPPPDGAPADDVVTVSSVVRTYGRGTTEVRALDGVSAAIARGRFTAVVGPSGSGKSTLMHCMAGLDSVSSGSIVLDGVEITGLSDRALTRLRRERVGFVFQSFNLLPQLTAYENIVLPVTMSGGRPDRELVDHLVEVLGIADRLSHRPAELSGGQQQRAAVARALVSRPAVVFADEPTGNLDSRVGAEVLSFLRRSVDELGQSVVMVTHDLVAARYADHVLTLADGRVAGCGAPAAPPSAGRNR